MAFEDAIARLNDTVMDQLSDVDALVEGQLVRGMLHRDAMSIDGISAEPLMLEIRSADIPFDLEPSASVLIGTLVGGTLTSPTSYRGKTPIDDGSGFVRIPLELDA